MPSTPKYVALEEASDRTSADIQSEYAEEKTELRRKHQAQKLLTYLSWYSAISTAIILMLSIALFTKSLQTSKMVRTADEHTLSIPSSRKNLTSQNPIPTETPSTQPGTCLPRPYRGSFGRHLEYQSLDHRFDILWDDIEDDLRVFWIPDPDEKSGERAAVIAMFHQLHCLQSFRMAIQLGHEGIDPGFDWKDEEMHWPHCFDYMRSVGLSFAPSLPSHFLTPVVVDPVLGRRYSGEVVISRQWDTRRYCRGLFR